MVGSEVVALVIGMLGLVVALPAQTTPNTGDLTPPFKLSCDEIRRSLEKTLKNSKQKPMFLDELPSFAYAHLPTLCDPTDPASAPDIVLRKQKGQSRAKRAFFFGINGGGGEGTGEAVPNGGFLFGNGFFFGNGMSSSNGKIKDPGDRPVNGMNGFFFGNGNGMATRDGGEKPLYNPLASIAQMALFSSLFNGGFNGFTINGYKNGGNGGNGGNGEAKGKIEVTVA